MILLDFLIKSQTVEVNMKFNTKLFSALKSQKSISILSDAVVKYGLRNLSNWKGDVVLVTDGRMNDHFFEVQYQPFQFQISYGDTA